MKVLVTGADGFVGGHLVKKLKEKNHRLFLIGEVVDKLKGICNNEHSYLSYLNLDQTELINRIKEFYPEFVINLAGYSTSSDSYADVEKLINANVLFLSRLLDSVKDIKLKCFIYTGSSTEYFKNDKILNPAYLYSASKSAGRSILAYYSDVYCFKSIVVTPFNIYGEINGQKKIIDILYNSLDSPEPVNTTQGEQVLDFIHVEDVAELYIRIMNEFDNIPDNTEFFAGTGKGTSIKQLAGFLELLTGKKANINWGGIPYRKKDLMYSVADIRKMEELLNWTPSVDLHTGLTMYLKSKE